MQHSLTENKSMSVGGGQHGNLLSVIDTSENRSLSRNDYCVRGRERIHIISNNGFNEKKLPIEIETKNEDNFALGLLLKIF